MKFLPHLHSSTDSHNQGRDGKKHADGADASVLFSSLAVLICWLYTCKLVKKSCAICTVPICTVR